MLSGPGAVKRIRPAVGAGIKKFGIAETGTLQETVRLIRPDTDTAKDHDFRILRQFIQSLP